MNKRILASILCFLIGLLAAQPSYSTQYNVTIDTSDFQGTSGAIAIDFTSPNSASNTVTLLNFSYDGVSDLPESQGGLVQGDIILLLNPAPATTIVDGFFFNQLLLPFTNFGNSISFTLQTTENGPPSPIVPQDKISVFLLGDNRLPLFSTTDPLGADALFVLCIDGTEPGILEVFENRASVVPGGGTTIVPGRDMDWFFSGVAQGGAVQFTVSNAITLQVTTNPGDTAEDVAAAVAAAINNDATLAASGITATANGSVVTTNADITSVVITDPGITHSSTPIIDIPTVSEWGLILLALSLLLLGGISVYKKRIRLKPQILAMVGV